MNEEVIIITGATKGIGKSTAKLLAAKGAAVVVNGRHSSSVDQVVDDIRVNGGKAAGAAISVTDPEAGDVLTDTALQHFGKVTGLINNAGVIHDRIFHRMELQEFTEVMDVHVKGTFICSQAVTNYFKSTHTPGFLLHMTSLAGLIGTVGQVNYSAAKAAIIGMMMTMAKELERDHIQVNAVAPAAKTDMTRPFLEKLELSSATEEEKQYWEIGTADQVADFLAGFIQNRSMDQTGVVYSINKDEAGIWLPPSYVML
ncbi:SDR family NAD(P)-dependent oxidoreductase [Halobacillus rhizosphaerae]|uniref:SDR family NAD(P)-dependent oxidoreductase n=1 Tax=Halobacillus rhizosphaerae TaxID=3064889 RepID=UPI00398B39B5